MTIAERTWLDDVRWTETYPDEPLVPAPIRFQSPYELVAPLGKQFGVSAKLDDAELLTRWSGYDPQPSDAAIAGATLLSQLDDVILNEGPDGAAERWRRAFGGTGDAAASIERVVVSVRKSRWENSHASVPSVIGMTAQDACAYLVAIGKLEQNIPISVARSFLHRSSRSSGSLAGLALSRAHLALRSNAIDIDDEHRLVLRAGVDQEERVVLSVGWRSKSKDIFEGYPNAERYAPHDERSDDCVLDHDGTRLVTTSVHRNFDSDRDASKAPAYLLPVVPASAIAEDLGRLLDEIVANPGKLLRSDARAAHWKAAHARTSLVAKRLVEGILLRYVPWPHPFKQRKANELAVTQEETRDAVVNLFARLLRARIDCEPPDVAAHFLALIRQGRAPLSVWPMPLEGVWGVKIRTGDHEWLKGSIWMEPGVTDDPGAALVFAGSGTHAFMDNGKRIECGAARCAISKSHY